MKLEDIHKALKDGKKVYWETYDYQVKRVPLRKNYAEFDNNHPTFLDGHTLEIVHTNGFGGLAHPDELKDCFQ
jgi:hypothetical protein